MFFFFFNKNIFIQQAFIENLQSAKTMLVFCFELTVQGLIQTIPALGFFVLFDWRVRSLKNWMNIWGYLSNKCKGKEEGFYRSPLPDLKEFYLSRLLWGLGSIPSRWNHEQNFVVPFSFSNFTTSSLIS